jgi:hypothetical protein
MRCKSVNASRRFRRRPDGWTRDAVVCSHRPLSLLRSYHRICGNHSSYIGDRRKRTYISNDLDPINLQKHQNQRVHSVEKSFYHCSPTSTPFFLRPRPLALGVKRDGLNGSRSKEEHSPVSISSAIALPQAGAHAMPLLVLRVGGGYRNPGVSYCWGQGETTCP